MVVLQDGENTAVVRLQYVSGCGKSTIKVRQKYAGSKAYVQLKYSKSTVKYGKSIVLYGNFFGCLLYSSGRAGAGGHCEAVPAIF